MNVQDEMVIRINKDMEIFVEEYDNGVISHKQVDVYAFLDCIRNSIVHEMVSSGLLPQNCISYAGGSKGNKYVVLDFTDTHADIAYEKTEYSQFPLPRLLFGFYISADGRIDSVRIGVAERGRITPSSRMHVYPFSNVSGFDLCTGSNTFPKIQSLHQLCI